ncbi:uL30 family ribosomal protein [Candidatus Woesearchaeota archaeon]|nr:uL30 family ribosomal protein [Candidatus Woesearchaeota archaeon]
MKKEETKPKKEEVASKKLALVRIRGDMKLSYKLKDTFTALNLHKKNWCVIVNNSPSNLGMIDKIKDYITWGEIDNETYALLTEKRAQPFKAGASDRKNKIQNTKFITINNQKYKKYFRLNPPLKGYGRKGIKKAFAQGGALGYRGEKINALIKRMI